MESFIFDAISKGLVSGGLPCILLAGGLWWMNKMMQAYVTSLNKERSERLDSLEKHNDACEKDRSALREQLIGLLKEDRTVVRSLPAEITQAIPAVTVTK